MGNSIGDTRRALRLGAGAALAAAALAAGEARAEAASAVFTTLQSKYFTAIGGILDKSQAAAAALLSVLLVMTLAWRLINAALDGRAELVTLMAMVVRTLVWGGFLHLLVGDGPALFMQLVADLSSLAGISGDPSYIMSVGLMAAQKIINTIEEGWFDAISLDNFVKIIVAAMVVVLHAFVALNVLLGMVTLYFVVCAGVLFVGFAATDWTRDIAVSWARACVGAAVRLYGMLLIYVLGVQVFISALNDFCEMSGQSETLTQTMVRVSGELVSATTSWVSETLSSWFSLGGSDSTVVAGGGTASTSTGAGSSSTVVETSTGAEGSADSGEAHKVISWEPLATIATAAIVEYVLISRLPEALAHAVSFHGQPLGVTAAAAASASGLSTLGHGARSAVLHTAAAPVRGGIGALGQAVGYFGGGAVAAVSAITGLAAGRLRRQAAAHIPGFAQASQHMGAALDKTLAALGSSDARARMSARESRRERERFGESFRGAGFDEVTSRIMARKAQVLQERYDLSRSEAGGEVLHEYQSRRPPPPSASGADGTTAGAAAPADAHAAAARAQAYPARTAAAHGAPKTRNTERQAHGGLDGRPQHEEADHGIRGQASARVLRGGRPDDHPPPEGRTISTAPGSRGM